MDNAAIFNIVKTSLKGGISLLVENSAARNISIAGMAVAASICVGKKILNLYSNKKLSPAEARVLEEAIQKVSNEEVKVKAE